MFRRDIFVNEEDNIKQYDESIEIKHLQDENNLLKDIIDRAAAAIADVVQVNSKEIYS